MGTTIEISGMFQFSIGILIEEKDQSKQYQEHLTQQFNSGPHSKRETGTMSPAKICHRQSACPPLRLNMDCRNKI